MLNKEIDFLCKKTIRHVLKNMKAGKTRLKSIYTTVLNKHYTDFESIKILNRQKPAKWMIFFFDVDTIRLTNKELLVATKFNYQMLFKYFEFYFKTNPKINQDILLQYLIRFDLNGFAFKNERIAENIVHLGLENLHYDRRPSTKPDMLSTNLKNPAPHSDIEAVLQTRHFEHMDVKTVLMRQRMDQNYCETLLFGMSMYMLNGKYNGPDLVKIYSKDIIKMAMNTPE